MKTLPKNTEAAPTLVEAVTLARDTFRRYAQLHMDKGTAQATGKAIANNELADRMDAALASAEASPSPVAAQATVTPAPWKERWEGSGPNHGWYIVEASRLCNNEAVAYLGPNVSTETVTMIVQAHNAALAAQAPKSARAGGEPKAYYMRDNHSFRRLPLEVDAAMAAIREEFDDGWTGGMLCTKDYRMDRRNVHANGKEHWAEFESAGRVWMEDFCRMAAP